MISLSHFTSWIQCCECPGVVWLRLHYDGREGLVTHTQQMRVSDEELGNEGWVGEGWTQSGDQKCVALQLLTARK